LLTVAQVNRGYSARSAVLGVMKTAPVVKLQADLYVTSAGLINNTPLVITHDLDRPVDKNNCSTYLKYGLLECCSIQAIHMDCVFRFSVGFFVILTTCYKMPPPPAGHLTTSAHKMPRVCTNFSLNFPALFSLALYIYCAKFMQK